MVPFLPTLARQLGFSTIVVGNVYTILPIIGLLFKPLFGYIADCFHIRKQILLIAQLLTAVAFLGILYIKPVNQTASSNLRCYNGVSDLQFCSSSSFAIDCVFTDHIDDRTLWNDPVTKMSELITTIKGSPMLTCTMECHAYDNNSALVFCGAHNPFCSFTMIANVKKSNIEHQGDCLFFMLKEAQLYNRNRKYNNILLLTNTY